MKLCLDDTPATGTKLDDEGCSRSYFEFVFLKGSDISYGEKDYDGVGQS